MDQNGKIEIVDMHIHLNGLEVMVIDELVKRGLYKDRGQLISRALRAYEPFKGLWEKRWDEEYQKLLAEEKEKKTG